MEPSEADNNGSDNYSLGNINADEKKDDNIINSSGAINCPVSGVPEDDETSQTTSGCATTGRLRTHSDHPLTSMETSNNPFTSQIAAQVELVETDKGISDKLDCDRVRARPGGAQWRKRKVFEDVPNKEGWMSFLDKTLSALVIKPLPVDLEQTFSTSEMISGTNSEHPNKILCSSTASPMRWNLPRRPGYILIGAEGLRVFYRERRDNAVNVTHHVLPHLIDKVKELECRAKILSEKCTGLALQEVKTEMPLTASPMELRLKALFTETYDFVILQQQLVQSDRHAFNSNIHIRAKHWLKLTEEAVELANLFHKGADAEEDTEMLEKLFLLIKHPVFDSMPLEGDGMKAGTCTMLGIEKEYIVEFERRSLKAIETCMYDVKHWVTLCEVCDERKEVRDTRKKCLYLLDKIDESLDRCRENDLESKTMWASLTQKAIALPLSYDSLRAREVFKQTRANITRIHVRTIVDFLEQLLLIIKQNFEALDRCQGSTS